MLNYLQFMLKQLPRSPLGCYLWILLTFMLLQNVFATCLTITSTEATSLMPSGEVALQSMYTLVNQIGTNAHMGLCVPIVPKSPSDIIVCNSLVSQYIKAVMVISAPCTPDMSNRISDYINPYDPCKYVVTRLLDGDYCQQ